MKYILYSLKDKYHLIRLGIAFLFALTLYSPLTSYASSNIFETDFENDRPSPDDTNKLLSSLSSSMPIESDNMCYGLDWTKPVDVIYYYDQFTTYSTFYTNNSKSKVDYTREYHYFIKNVIKNPDNSIYYFAPPISQYDGRYILYKYDPSTGIGTAAKFSTESSYQKILDIYFYPSSPDRNITYSNFRVSSDLISFITPSSGFGKKYGDYSGTTSDSYSIRHFNGTNIPVFSSQLGAYNFFTNGDKDGLLNESTTQNKDIGYLEGLKHEDTKFVYDKNGNPSEIYNVFTWADTYDYDNNYKVELSYRIRAQTCPYPLLGGRPSTIKEHMSEFYLLEPCNYNDLRVEIDYMKDIAPIVKEYTNTLPSLGVMQSTSIQYFFRIYYHNEKSGVKFYGPYTYYLNKSDNLFAGETDNFEFGYGDFVSNGDFVIDNDRPPVPADPPNIGSGNSKEEAEDDLNNSKDPNRPTDPTVPDSGGSSFPEWNGEFSWEYIAQIFDWIFSSIKNFFLAMGQFPSFISAVFPFLPNSVSSFIASALIIAIMLRIIGR